MEHSALTIRNTIRAVIIQNGYVLLQKKQDSEQGIRYALPGGAQEPGETVLQTLHRECHEELGTEVIIGELLHLGEYFKQKLLPQPHTRHQLEILFSCQVAQTYKPQNGPKPDKHQVAIKWIALDSLSQLNLQPIFLLDILNQLAKSTNPVYLGTID